MAFFKSGKKDEANHYDRNHGHDNDAKGSEPSSRPSGWDPDSYVYSRKKKKAPADPESYVYRGGNADPNAASPSRGDLNNAVESTAGPGKAPRKESGKTPRRRGLGGFGSEVYKDTSETDPDYWNKSLEQRYEENYPAERRILLRNIKRVAAIILAMFMGLMSYLAYFQVTKAEDLRADSGNRRNAEARNRVLRGTLYDRNGSALSESTLHDDGTQTREYLGGEAFGNILGFVSDKYAITGLELTLDKTLSKAVGIESYFTLDFIKSLLNPEEAVTRKQEGHSVTLTLDKNLQRFAFEALEGRKGSVVALNPKTGEILAMVSSPGFSAANLDEVMERVNEDEDYAATAPLINRAIHSLYAPGSTMKVVTLTSALQNIDGVEERIFDDKGVIEFPDGSVIRNFNDNVYGEMNLQEAFTNSSNYVFGNLGIELSNAQLKSTAEAFGFNEEITMVGMTARTSVFPSLGDREQGNKALSALGQGKVAATPLQIAMVSQAIANDGMLADPFIVGQTWDKDGQLVDETEPLLREAVSSALAEKVKELMVGNVEYGGSLYNSLQDINGAGKTGTGQFEVGDGTRVNAWFTGFAPADDPEIAIAVVLEDLEDINDSTGARQALPIAREIMSYWLNR